MYIDKVEVSSSWINELIIQKVLSYPEPSTTLAAVLFLERSNALSEPFLTADADWVAAVLAAIKAAVQSLLLSSGNQIQKCSQMWPEQQSHTGAHGAAQPPAATPNQSQTRKRKAAAYNLMGQTDCKIPYQGLNPRAKPARVEQVKMLSKQQHGASCKTTRIDGIETEGRCSATSVGTQSAQAAARKVQQT